jgi:hypothetical protein
MQIARAGDRALLIDLGDVTAAELHASAEAVRGFADAVVPGHSSLFLRSAQGADLEEFLARTGQQLDHFLARVSTLRLRARYLGFRGGFAYLDGWPEEWAMPRRATSRPVPRGSFAIAGNVAGFYPLDTPGGWNLLGRTDAALAYAIKAGDEIVIEPTLETLPGPSVVQLPRLTIDDVEIVNAPLTTIVDGEDWSRTQRGLSPGGAFDDVAAALANRAVGNAADAPLLECALVAPKVRFHRDKVVAWFDGALHVEEVRAGEERAFGRVNHGLRGYVAIGETRGDVAQLERGPRDVIRVLAGPHDVGLRELTCEVTPKLDRVGIRMQPLAPVDIDIPADLKSCGMQAGTMQLHPDGSVVVMGPEHPITGGYLQPLTVLSSERWKLAQLMPGERVRFVAVDYSP